MITNVPKHYRPNVGLMLISSDRRIFVGERAGMPGAWQMPQGGVDDGETAIEAACRELAEEVGTNRALLMRESRDWLTYDFPSDIGRKRWQGRWRGQAQKWFALAFTGRDEDIDIHAHDHEFDAWKWASAAEVLDLIVAFKRPVYETVLAEFKDLVS
ncbi:putative (di)nucleoside polyphosphate hydrolase [Enhydrobacter aerosaccus]|uniref:RNA pyrophosphohydrolase n=1 Tax=Enhydrobacter aerosaccus TaxID=225324 RepID=A0A1T4NLW2_9HYPH|nr:RNA pyrophosphohydrolase [Enhydrobacter aerosaccus]SJZ79748.1 putative (di)nucleoside polyphosphate hydrolase [Enhydrobacter aerosaccus]